MSTVILRVVEVCFNLTSEGYGEFGWFMFAKCHPPPPAMILISLPNAIYSRRSQQPYGGCGSAILPASATKVFVRFSRYKHIRSSCIRIRLQLQHDFYMSALPRHTVGCSISRTPPLSKTHNTRVLSSSQMQFSGISQRPMLLYAC